MSSDEFDAVLPQALRSQLSPSSLGSTPIDYSGVVEEVAKTASTGERSASGFTCVECGSVLSTNSGFTRHKMVHKLDDYNSRKLNEDGLRENLPDLFQSVLREILEEPAVGELGAEKRRLVEAINCSTSIGQLSEAFAKPLIKILIVRKKVMPSAQLEECLKQLNAFQAQEESYETLKSDLVLAVANLHEFSPAVVKRLVWRITFNLMFKFQELVFHNMRKNNLAIQKTFVMDENERECFEWHLEKTFRSMYRFGLGANCAMWSRRCQCLREKFICAEGSVSSQQFTDEKEWGKGGIVLSAPCLNMCFGLERIMQNLHDRAKEFSSEMVFDSLTNPENLAILDAMRQLSRGILSEDVSIAFLKDIIVSLSALSVKKDALQKYTKASKKQKTSEVPLRTNLKRNPTLKVPEPPGGEQQEDSSLNPNSTVEQAASSSSTGKTRKAASSQSSKGKTSKKSPKAGECSSSIGNTSKTSSKAGSSKGETSKISLKTTGKGKASKTSPKAAGSQGKTSKISPKAAGSQGKTSKISPKAAASTPSRKKVSAGEGGSIQRSQTPSTSSTRSSSRIKARQEK